MKNKANIDEQRLDCSEQTGRKKHRERRAKERRDKLSELVFILDRSGSMSGLESDTAGGFNATIKEQKAQPGRALVSTMLFDHECLWLHDRTDIRKIKKMSRRDYTVRGMTALYDAIGSAVERTEFIHQHIRPDDVPDETIFVIMTDGCENASHSYSLDQIRQKIEKAQAKGWKFLFLGANLDAASTAASMGMNTDYAVETISDQQGVALSYDSASQAVSSIRAQGCAAPAWKAGIEADTRKRQGSRRFRS